MSEGQLIYIGQKPTMNYVLVTVSKLNGGEVPIIIKARGKNISKAVDVALIVKDRYVKNAKLERIEINTEVLPGQDSKPLNVSSIEISLQKG
ncbi:MAG: DNA-binding protein Alba [Methanomassiliicoccales archaeon]|nr:DNA-binding protein Alba [Methanomassiliicoccales archaeon]